MFVPLHVLMMVKVLLVPLCFLLTSFTGVCPWKLEEICVKAGEMVALHCPHHKEVNPSDANLIWTSHTSQEMNLTGNTTSAEQRRMGVLLHGRSLVILSASVNHQGNYSCSLRNASSRFWFRLTVYATETTEYDERKTYPATCYTQEACTLYCPDVNTPNMTSNGIIWHKKGESLPIDSYFSSVEEKDHGVYTCTRSYLYLQQIYNMTFKIDLDVQPNSKQRSPAIISPHMSDVFHVDLGSTVVIACKAVTFSDFDSLFWFNGDSMLNNKDNLPVFYNETRVDDGERINRTASLVIKKVTKEDLSKNYTCKLECDDQPSSFVTITLALKASPSYISLALGLVCTVVLMVMTTAIYAKFKISITLFLRDTLACHRSISDGKSYDAFLMCYKSDTEAGLNEDDREWLKCVLEEKYGYSLCLYDRDILPGKAVAEAVLDCIEQSRTVVLVPTSSDPGLGSGLLSVIHSALVERKTRLVFITAESTEVSRSGSVPEALQLLGKAGDCVTWKGKRSMEAASSFWKHLRYHLPAPQHVSKIRLLPQTV
uniref:interleukin-1 receptor type 1-like n=1 Tax=Semicossyphus pulcher TaxID=241346 RepID=UPI0037E85B5A